jgi:hypothetical protein
VILQKSLEILGVKCQFNLGRITECFVMKKDYSRKIGLFSPLCASEIFSYDDEKEDSLVECLDCKKTFTRDEIREANQENIANNVEAVEKEIMRDIESHLKKILKGNKHFKIK